MGKGRKECDEQDGREREYRAASALELSKLDTSDNYDEVVVEV